MDVAGMGSVILTDEDLMNEDRAPFVTVTSGMRGYFAVLMTCAEDGYWEPEQTGIGSYRTPDEAWREAQDWAVAEGIRSKR
jgi:hypothetical protein